MTHDTYPAGDTSPTPQTHELSPEVLEGVLQPDEPLAAQFLDRSIATAESDPQTDQEALELLRFQRSLVDMSPIDADGAVQKFVQQTGKYATTAHTFGRRPPMLHFPVNRELFVPRMANEERWRVIGIDPSQYGDSAYEHAWQQDIEESWRLAREAREALQTAQATEATAMERASHPPVYVPRAAAA